MQCHRGLNFDTAIAILTFKILSKLILHMHIGLGTGVLCDIIVIFPKTGV